MDRLKLPSWRKRRSQTLRVQLAAESAPKLYCRLSDPAALVPRAVELVFAGFA